MMISEECFMCRCDVIDESGLEEHMKIDHGILFDLDLLLLIQHFDEEEKFELKSIMAQRHRKSEIRNFAKNHIKDEINTVGYSYKDSIMGGEKMEESDILNSCSPKVEDEKSPIASKLSFWEDFTGIRGGNSPVNIIDTHKNPIKKDQIVNKLLMPAMSQGCSPKIRMSKSITVGFDWNSGKKSLKESKPAVIPTVSSRKKSANDTIDVFDDVFASNCDDFNESIEGAFGRLVDEVKLGDEVDDISISSDRSFGHYDLTETSQLCKEDVEASSRTSMEGGQYVCPQCKKTFRFLTFLKVHTSSKFLCTRPAQ